ncbi:hypothetical protein LR48_Vigan205s004100 [Vigna angularis]|uniref:Uncharacterized protein n=1 Tax=Phaseolus angularis TaxID=3914 RepID=A0A0L9T720_PHAAN|nr:hypothetical protein LR48_Vigan205s004100 [Vigna angularis]
MGTKMFQNGRVQTCRQSPSLNIMSFDMFVLTVSVPLLRFVVARVLGRLILHWLQGDVQEDGLEWIARAATHKSSSSSCRPRVVSLEELDQEELYLEELNQEDLYLEELDLEWSILRSSNQRSST